MSLREITRFDDHYEASVAASFLGAHDIDVFVSDSNLSTMNPMMQRALGGIRVLAPADQIAEARALLGRARAGEFLAEEGDPVDETPRRRLIGAGAALGLFLAGAGLFWGTTGVRHVRPIHWAGLGMIGVLVLGSYAVAWWATTRGPAVYPEYVDYSNW